MRERLALKAITSSQTGSKPCWYDHLDRPLKNSKLVLVDDAHGQGHWRATGFTSREVHSNFSGLAELVTALNAAPHPSGQALSVQRLSEASLLIIPSPAGKYDRKRERWRRDPATFFTPEEIVAILQFLKEGGRLLAFAYRFGDSFTETNLKDVFSPLGCHLNDDAVVDISQLRHQHPLKSEFQTPAELIIPRWAREKVTNVRWRTAATFTILPGATASPLVLSPGGRCLAFNRVTREISFSSLPVAVTGSYGRGRFALFGGLHLFENTPLGLLSSEENTRFANNVLRWLLQDGLDDIVHTNLPEPDTSFAAPSGERWSEISRIAETATGHKTIEFVERELKKRGVLRALSLSRWAP